MDRGYPAHSEGFMRVLITGAATPLGQALAADLSDDYKLRLSDRTLAESDHEYFRCDLDHDASTDALVQGVDTIIHQPLGAEDSAACLDACGRCTYNLLLAAMGAGVKQVILISSLDLMRAYDEDMTVSEDWRPRPSTEPAVLAIHISEFVAREFAHDKALKLLIMRLGHVVDEEQTQGQPFDPMWVETGDAVQAVRAAMSKDLPGYSIVHIQAESAKARFSVGHAKSWLGYDPQVNFTEAL